MQPWPGVGLEIKTTEKDNGSPGPFHPHEFRKNMYFRAMTTGEHCCFIFRSQADLFFFPQTANFPKESDKIYQLGGLGD